MTTYGKYKALAVKHCDSSPITGLNCHEAHMIYNAALRMMMSAKITRTGDRIDKKYSVKVFAIPKNRNK